MEGGNIGDGNVKGKEPVEDFDTGGRRRRRGENWCAGKCGGWKVEVEEGLATGGCSWRRWRWERKLEVEVKVLRVEQKCGGGRRALEDCSGVDRKVEGSGARMLNVRENWYKGNRGGIGR